MIQRYVGELIGQRRAWHSLPQPFYTDEAIFEVEQRAIFGRSWIMVGFESQFERPGSYVAMNVGRTPIVVLRDRSDRIVGFHNSCRHRGAQICPTGHGRVPRLVCPYHQWSYGLDGGLIRANRMSDDFDPAQHGLRPIHVESVAGCVYACIAEEPPEFGGFRDALEVALSPYHLRNTKVAHVEVLREEANWKLVMENGRECHHCAACHPELQVAFPVSIADGAAFHEDMATGAFMARMRDEGIAFPAMAGEWWQVARVPFNPGVMSYSLDGAPLVSKLVCDRNGGNVGSLRWAIEPNNFCHVAGDNAVMVNVMPLDARTTEVTSTWFVHKDAVEGVDYDVARLIHVWDQTNRQDRDLAENNQRGVAGLGYVPGPYSREAESYVNLFVDWYCDRMRTFSDYRPLELAA